MSSILRDDDEDLAAAEAFALDRLAQDEAVPGHDEGADGQAIHRRRRDHAHLAHAGERQLQGARDGRGRQRQHVHAGLKLLQALLVLHAEVLLLIHDDEAEIGELDRLAQQRMGADHDVDRAVGEAGLHHRRLLRRHHAGELRDLHRHACEARGEGAVMLAGQQRRGHDHRHLHAGHGDGEGGAQRDLRLAEADVAADEAVHRLARGEVLQHVGDGARLVVGLDIGEARAELVPGALRAAP
jgi:hypothetical protein